jgi:hypothetical protein
MSFLPFMHYYLCCTENEFASCTNDGSDSILQDSQLIYTPNWGYNN